MNALRDDEESGPLSSQIESGRYRPGRPLVARTAPSEHFRVVVIGQPTVRGNAQCRFGAGCCWWTHSPSSFSANDFVIQDCPAGDRRARGSCYARYGTESQGPILGQGGFLGWGAQLSWTRTVTSWAVPGCLRGRGAQGPGQPDHTKLLLVKVGIAERRLAAGGRHTAPFWVDIGR